MKKFSHNIIEWRFATGKSRPEEVSTTIPCRLVRCFNHLFGNILKTGYAMMGNIWPRSNQIFGFLGRGSEYRPDGSWLKSQTGEWPWIIDFL
jgi:hypothetical protein